MITLGSDRTVYAIAASATANLVVIPGGGSFFRGLTQGLGKLAIPAILSPDFATGVSGWSINKNGSAEFNNITIRNGEIISGVFLLYSSAIPAKGNLVVAFAPIAAGVDAVGNVYPQGFNFGVWDNTGALKQHFGIDANGAVYIAGPDNVNRVIINNGSYGLGPDIRLFNDFGAVIAVIDPVHAGFFLYNDLGSAVQGGLQIALANKNTADPIIGGSVNTGLTVYGSAIAFGAAGSALPGDTTLTSPASKQLGFNGSMVWDGIAIPPAPPPGKGLLFAQTTGRIATGNPSGLAQNVQGAQSDLSVFTVTAAAFQQFSKAWTIPANDAFVGATYRIRVTGNGTQGSTVEVLNIALQLGGTNFGGSGINSGFAGISAAFSFWAELEVVCVSIGVAGTFQASKFAAAGDTTGHNQFAVDSTVPGSLIVMDTTIDQTFLAIADWNSIVGAPTVTCRRSIFERVV